MTRYLFTLKWKDFNETRRKCLPEWGTAEKFFQGQRSKVKVTIRPNADYNGGGMHFTGVASRVTCFSEEKFAVLDRKRNTNKQGE